MCTLAPERDVKRTGAITAQMNGSHNYYSTTSKRPGSGRERGTEGCEARWGGQLPKRLRRTRARLLTRNRRRQIRGGRAPSCGYDFFDNGTRFILSGEK